MLFWIGIILVRKIPDLGEVIGWILRLDFSKFIDKMEGLHYKINQYNPFTPESSRYFVDENSVVTELNPEWNNGVIIILNIWAIRRFDRLRWRITVWS